MGAKNTKTQDIPIERIPLADLLEDLQASENDIAICHVALAHNIYKHNGIDVQEHLDTNKAIITRIEAELGRRKRKGAHRRYLVKEVDGWDNVRVFKVDEIKIDLDVDVWFNTLDNRINCTYCYGPLSAMLANCPHCKAVQRHLNKINKQIKKCQTPALSYIKFFEDAQRRLSSGEIRVICMTCQRYQWKDNLCTLAKVRDEKAAKS